MRVALISPLFESVPPRMYGGTERVVYNLCRGLTEGNHEVTVFASGDSSVEGRVVPVIDEAIRLSRRKIRDPLAYNLKMLAMVSEMAAEFDVIHNHHDYWMFPLSKMTNVPVMTTTHGRLDLPDTVEVYRAYPENNLVSISDAQRGPLGDLHWLRTVHHGLDLEEFDFFPKSGKYLAFLGRVDHNKRPDLAIEIAKRSGVPLKIAAKIEGDDGQEYYDRLIKPHIDGRFIEFVGEISEGEKSEFLGNALALCFPIDWPEPFGLVVIESLACGTPVLARPHGAVPELLENGLTGFVHDDPAVLASRVKDLSKISRKACRQWVQDRFSLKRMTEDYIHVYRHLIEFSAAHRHRRNFLHPVERFAHRHS